MDKLMQKIYKKIEKKTNKIPSLPVRIDQNKESITLIWFDPNIDSVEDAELTKQQLRSINDYVSFFTDVDRCVKYIRSINHEKIFLITSGSKASYILSRVANLDQVDLIFVFCMMKDKWMHLTDEYDKIIGIYVNLDELCSSIRHQIDLFNKQLQTFSAFDHRERSTKDLSQQSAEFLWFQLFHQLIVLLPVNQQAKQQMLEFCRNYYRGNRAELNMIERFENEFCGSNAIQWYSKQSFLFKLINKALRTEDLNQLQTFRFFIRDLSNSLVKEQEQLFLSSEKILNLYRGTYLDRKELEKLQANQGKIISTNGYLSTSRSRTRAMKFIKKATRSPNDVRVLFHIECHVEKIGKSVTYADIARFSTYPAEEEVLFDLNAAFQLISIEENDSINFVRMDVSTEGERITKDYMNLTKQEVESKSVAIVLGQLMCNLGQYNQSQEYFEELLKEPNGEDLAWIEFNIGQALDYKSQWEQARTYYNRAYDRMIEAIPPRVKDVAVVMNNIAGSLYRQGKFNEALDLHKRILQIREEIYPNGHVDIAQSLNYIALILDQQGKYEQALEYHQRALKVRQAFYPDDHVDIAASLNNIGHTLYHQQKYDQALDNCQRALKIREQFYPNGHIDTAKSIHTIGHIYDAQRKYDESLSCHHQALTMRKRLLPPDHPYIAASLDAIGSVLYHQGRVGEALQYHRQALVMRQVSYPDGHSDIGYSFVQLAECCEEQNQSDTALGYYLQALSIFDKFLPHNHPVALRVKCNIDRLTEKQ
ncbi:unnamed protein product [Adineta ricciae]|uniref:NAD(P)(+)--arginine ADP-ribosyltransferase n=1 Tax=Adineta ricciae TaxID=249248 RepID=A0A816E7C0_ADIRI|nr:unnamed protein product [Adineta ricciae]CAF1643032.1 unnamed protein product [Adineta ricciae]